MTNGVSYQWWHVSDQIRDATIIDFVCMIIVLGIITVSGLL